MRRRRLLALVCTAFPSTVGCLDRSGSERTPTRNTPKSSSSTVTATQTEPASPAGAPVKTLALGETYEAADGTTATVHGVAVRKLVRSTAAGRSTTHIDVGCAANHQYVVVDAEVSDVDAGSLLSGELLGVVVDGVRFPRQSERFIGAVPPGSHSIPGRPAVPVPVSDASEAVIAWRRADAPPVHWTLPSTQVAQLGQSPAFSISSIEMPDSVGRGESFEATFSVRNTGDRDGRFVAELGAGPVSDYGEVVVEVPAGKIRTHTSTLSPYVTEGVDELDAALDWGCERLTRTIAVTD